MNRRVLPSAESKFRTDEATGTRRKEEVCGERPQLSPCAVAGRWLEAGRAQDALHMLEQEVASGNESGDLHFWLGRAAFQLGDHARAQRAFFRASALSPDDAQARRWLARVLLRRGNGLGAMRILSSSGRSSAPPPPAPESQLPAAQSTAPGALDGDSEEPATSEWIPSVRRPRAP